MFGLKVVVGNCLPRFKMVQYKFPKSKAKRIIKKWQKDRRNYKQVESHDAFIMDGSIFMNPCDFGSLGRSCVKIINLGG